MNIKTILKTTVAAAALMAFAAPTMAADPNMDRAQPKVKLKIYGQVNKAVMYADDGNNGRSFIGDNSGGSSSRMGFLFDAPVNADFSFQGLWEMDWRHNDLGLQSPGGGAAGASTDTVTTNDAWRMRHQDVRMIHKRFGKLSLGQGSSAADGAVEINNSGAGMVIGAAEAGVNGASTNLWNNTTRTYTGTTLGTYFGYDQGARANRVRYDTPAFMGASVAVSARSGGQSEVALLYANKIQTFKIDGAFGYVNVSGENATGEDALAGSLSVLHDSGINASIAGSTRNNKKSNNAAGTARNDSTFVGGSVGYIAKVFGVGPTAFAVDMYKAENKAAATTSASEWEVTTWALGVQQTFSDIGADVYLGYRNFEIDAPVGTTIDDVNLVIAGVRVQF